MHNSSLFIFNTIFSVLFHYLYYKTHQTHQSPPIKQTGSLLLNLSLTLTRLTSHHHLTKSHLSPQSIPLTLTFLLNRLSLTLPSLLDSTSSHVRILVTIRLDPFIFLNLTPTSLLIRRRNLLNFIWKIAVQRFQGCWNLELELGSCNGRLD